MFKLKMFAAASALALAGAAVPASATLTLTLAGAPGYDLTKIKAGDTFHIDAILGGSAGEFYESSTGNIFNSSNITVDNFAFGPNRRTEDLASMPVLIDFTLTALQAGSAALSLDYTNGSIITTAATYMPTATVNFAVQPAAAVPEPATWAMMILGMGAIGFAMRSAKRRSDEKFDAKIKRITDGAFA